MNRVVFLLVLLIAVGAVTAQVESPGILSYIEDGPEPGSAEGLYRQTPFVEVIHKELLARCREQAFQETCPQYEWSVPFLPAVAATDSEDLIAGEWFRFETRAYWRALLEVGAVNPLITCTLGGLDLYWFMYSGDLFFPPGEFCDDTALSILPECLFACDLPPIECPLARPDCTLCFEQGLARALAHAMRVYYPQYQEAVYRQALALSARGALWWGDAPLLEGALVAVVAHPLNQPAWLEDIATTLIAGGVAVDPRAASYYTQTAAGNAACRATLLAGSVLGLVRLPGEALDPQAPGLNALEERKRLLADRESAGDTWKRTLMLFTDRETLSPKYRKADSPLGNIFGGEAAKLGTASPTAHACLGQATFLELYQKAEVVLPLHRPVQRPTVCIVGVTVVPALPQFLTFASPRWHTDWVSVPEGYEIPKVKGEPGRVEP